MNVACPWPAFSATKRTNRAPIRFNQEPHVLKATRQAEERDVIVIPTFMAVETLRWSCRRAIQYLQPSKGLLCIPQKRSWNIARSPLSVGHRKKQKTMVRDHLPPTKPPGSRLWVLVHNGSLLPWLVDNEAALHHH